MEPSESPKRDKEWDPVRFPAFVQLWSHHNQMQLQWPAVIIGTTLLFLAYIVVGKSEKIACVSKWGHDKDLQFIVGLPMFLTGLSLMVMLYLMYRARLIMTRLEGQIDEIERGRVLVAFTDINHPKRGVSGTKLIWFFMLFFLAMPMLAFGALFGLGPVLSIIPLSIIVLIAGGIWVHTKAKA